MKKNIILVKTIDNGYFLLVFKNRTKSRKHTENHMLNLLKIQKLLYEIGMNFIDRNCYIRSKIKWKNFAVDSKEMLK